MNKTTISIGMFVILAVGIGTALAVSQQQHTLPVTPGVYHSTDAGLEFAYPTTYNLEERQDNFAGKDVTVLTIIDKNVVIPDMSEGPATIAVLVVDNPENMPLDQWIRTQSISNWYLSNPEAEMGGSTVGDESGLGYVYDGLYQNTAIAVAHKGKIYLFTVGTLTSEDQIKKDYFDILDSVKFL